MVKNLPANAEDVRDIGFIPGSGRSRKEGMATYSSILAWRISMDRGAWLATVHRITKSWRELKRISKHIIQIYTHINIHTTSYG